jgi:hypothetical protein
MSEKILDSYKQESIKLINEITDIDEIKNIMEDKQ